MHRLSVLRVALRGAREGLGPEGRWDRRRVDEVQLDELIEHAPLDPELLQDLRHATVKRGDHPFLGPGEKRVDDRPLMRVAGLAGDLERGRELGPQREVFPETVGGALRQGGAARRRLAPQAGIVCGPEVGLDVPSARSTCSSCRTFTPGGPMAGSPLPSPLALAFSVSEPPDLESAALIVVDGVATDAYLLAYDQIRLVGAEGLERAPGRVHNRVALVVRPAGVAHEAPLVDDRRAAE